MVRTSPITGDPRITSTTRDLGIEVFTPERADSVDVSSRRRASCESPPGSAWSMLRDGNAPVRRWPSSTIRRVTFDDTRPPRPWRCCTSYDADFQVIYLDDFEALQRGGCSRVVILEGPTAADAGADAVVTGLTAKSNRLVDPPADHPLRAALRASPRHQLRRLSRRPSAVPSRRRTGAAGAGRRTGGRSWRSCRGEASPARRLRVAALAGFTPALGMAGLYQGLGQRPDRHRGAPSPASSRRRSRSPSAGCHGHAEHLGMDRIGVALLAVVLMSIAQPSSPGVQPASRSGSSPGWASACQTSSRRGSRRASSSGRVIVRTLEGVAMVDAPSC